MADQFDEWRETLKEETRIEEVFKSIFSNSSVGIVTLDIDGNITLANPVALSLLKVEKLPDKLNISDLDIIGKETLEYLSEIFKERRKSTGAMDRALKIVYRDGEHKWVQLRSNEISGKDGDTKGYSVLLTDITERVESERELEQSAGRFEMVVERLHEGVAITDLDENIKFANGALGKLLGISPENLKGMNISSFVSGNDLETVRSKTLSRKKGVRDDYEIKVRSADGKEKDVLVHASPWTDENGALRGTMGLLLDITKQKESQRNLRANEEKYRATVEQSAENIYIYDIGSKRIVEANRTLQNLLGYTTEEMKRLRPADFIAHTKEDVREHIEWVQEKGKAIIGERTYIRKDGTPVDVEVSASLIKEGDHPMLCVVSRDVTERKRARRQLIEKKNLAEFYLDLLAHDMGNIHHGMMAGLDLYEMYGADLDKKEMAIGKVKELLSRSLRLAYNIKTYTKVRSSKPILSKMKLSDLVERGYEAAVGSFPDKDVEHVTGWDNKDHMVMAEPLMEEIFYNIYHNALKYQKGKRTFLETRVEEKKDGRIRIEISDQGMGIPDSMKKQIFERSRDPSGMQHTGLGLVIIDTLVERYLGEVWVENRIRGDHTRGSVFKMEFPGSS
ncbi:MAG: PAS domain-containing sensor histidine kinase [Thermoplasmatota archaeon]